MDKESFRRHAHELVDWMADYLESVEDYPVRSQSAPGEMSEKLPASPPTRPEAFADIFNDFKTDVMPGITHWQHPRFFAYFPANASPPSILAEMLTSTLAANCMVWQTSPAGTEMETRVMDWLRQMIGLPDGFSGVIQDTASSAILCAILTARERISDWAVNEKGLGAVPPMAVYTSEQTHSSTEKNVKIAGLGVQALRKIPTDREYRLDVGALEKAIETDLANGIRPACVVASIGGTGVGAIDPLRDIGEFCQKHGIFLHVDAAWAGSALICPEYRWMIDGIELVDSLVFNPHKWLLTNFDCSAHFLKSPNELIRIFSILPEYLKGQNTGEVIDYRDWGVQLGRRFRALKLWFVIRSYGVEGLQALIRKHIALAESLESWVEADEAFQMVAPRSLALVTFRYVRPGISDEVEHDRLNEELLTRLNDEGFVYLTQNRLDGRYVIRFSIGQTDCELRHVEEGWEAIKRMASLI